jgi:predicted dehydrogenase
MKLALPAGKRLSSWPLGGKKASNRPSNHFLNEGGSMSEQIRVGIVGTSWWADLMFLPSLNSHPRAATAAICGRNRHRAEEMARKYDIPQVFTDYQEMIEQGHLQALVVAAPDDLHYPITMTALEAGLHVLCEKPLALNAGHAKTMYEKAEVMGVKHMVLFTWRWLPHFQYLHRLIEEGYIGRCFHCQLSFLGGYGRDGQYMWRFDRQRANGILGDLGSHMIDFARWYVGDIAKVSAHLTTFVERSDPDGQPLDPANDAALLAIEFVNGAQGIIQVSAVAHVGDRLVEQHLSLHGEAGTLQTDVLFEGVESGAVIRGARHHEKQFQTLPVPDKLWGDVDRSDFASAQVPGLFVKQPVGSRQFIDAIVEDQPVSPNFYDGFKAQEVIDAAIESHRSGCWVSLL